MYEICRLLAQPKIKKARKTAISRIKVGAKVIIYSMGAHPGIVVSSRGQGNWNVQVGDRMTWANRSVIEVVS